MVAAQRQLNHAYVLHGCGGLTIVQARLAEYGLFYSSFWDSSPPDWRFHYLTYLQFDELVHLLKDVTDHFVIRCYRDESVNVIWLQKWLGL